tara:strand:- start:18156 stop:18320 length:165 start_codon:yes stop_codon:yes gene_type:complete
MAFLFQKNAKNFEASDINYIGTCNQYFLYLIEINKIQKELGSMVFAKAKNNQSP